ncbi:hypothetical protein [Demequina activiva]|uniref:Uncharacterized protein n=1 Tax=Demequina activiva TaxID=1582364 RepID=A0A919PZP2_9MICO|nr:hypothetical protein [Demequina activiva]GIG53640.1 hypothetical protein Dac01nite_03920 [Demequina activiva]
MAKDDDARRREDDPDALEWPDERLGARDQEAANEAALNEKAPVGRPLAALILGILIVEMFVLAVNVPTGDISLFLQLAAPIALGGAVVGLPAGYALDRVVRRMRRGVGEIAFVVMGGAIGYGLTWAGLTLLSDQFGDVGEFTTFRAYASMFMLTATAAGFLGAYMLADKLRRYPKQVAILGTFVAVLVVLSATTLLFGSGA